MAFARKIKRNHKARREWLKKPFGATKLWLRQARRPPFKLFVLEAVAAERDRRQAEIDAKFAEVRS